ARDDDERLVQLRAGKSNRAGGAEGRLLDRILDRHPERLAVAEVAPDRLREEGDRDDDVVETMAAEQLEDVLHARLADDRHHRLRLVRRQRPQARALAPCHHDGLHVRTVLAAALTYIAAAAAAIPRPVQK